MTQYITKFYPDVKNLLRGEAPMVCFFELIFQRLSLDTFHYEIPMIGISKVIKDTRNVIVFQPGEIFDFAIIRNPLPRSSVVG